MLISSFVKQYYLKNEYTPDKVWWKMFGFSLFSHMNDHGMIMECTWMHFIDGECTWMYFIDGSLWESVHTHLDRPLIDLSSHLSVHIQIALDFLRSI